MDFSNSFLAWLFGSKQTETEQEENLPEPSPDSSPEEREEAREEKPQSDARHELTLPQSHAIYRLWSLRTEQAGWLPQPTLYLEEPSDPLMPDQEANQELLRLQMFVNSTANERVNRLRTQSQAKNAEQSTLPDLDAHAAVFLSKDSLTAWLLVYPPVGRGKELDREILDQALAEQRVTFGVDTGLLDRLPQDGDRYFHLFPAARGTPAVNGTDGRVVDMFPRAQERKLTVDENNRVDYTNLNFIHNVEVNDIICRILPPTEGTPGQTVQNETVPAKPGKAASVPKGRNTQLSEDGETLVATIAGHVEFSGRGFQVRPLLDIPGNVDFSVGNINFLGDVHIHGDICSGFTVRAMGNITVEGVVEACTVEAGKDLIVARGVQGDNQAVIRAQQNLFAKYLENSCVYVKNSLETECIINCDVYCDGGVTVRSGHRSIIGGSIRAAHEVSAGIIGSRAENRTDVVLGGQPCAKFDYDMLARELQELEDEMGRTERQPDSPSKVSHLGKLRMQIIVNRKKLELLDKETMEQEPQDPGIRRMIGDVVFGGTVLTIGSAVYRFRNRTAPCSATLVEDEIRVI